MIVRAIVACSACVLALLYYVFVWPLQLLLQGIFDAVCVMLKLKRTVSVGRPVWRQPLFSWWSWRFRDRRNLPRAEIRRQ